MMTYPEWKLRTGRHRGVKLPAYLRNRRIVEIREEVYALKRRTWRNMNTVIATQKIWDTAFSVVATRSLY